jgi:hypothetical protein
MFNDHDFRSASQGIGIPYGIYDMASTTPRPTAAVCFWELPTKHPPSLSLVFASGGKRKDTGTTPNPAPSSFWPILAAVMARSVAPGSRRFSGSFAMAFGTHRHRLSLPFRRLQMEPHRASFVQPDQQELGSRASGQLREGSEVYPHHHNHYRLKSDCWPRSHLLSDGRQSLKTGSRTTLHQEERVLPKWNYTISPKM